MTNLAARNDIRDSDSYRAVEQWYTDLIAPSFGTISDAADLDATPDGTRIAFTATVWQKLADTPSSRIAVVDVASGDCETVTGGRHSDRYPRWSPDGSSLAFLSDRDEKGHFQVYRLVADRTGEAEALPLVEGTVEYIAWSPDGTKLLVAAAGPGADMAGGQGSGTTAEAADELPSWSPMVAAGVSAHQWRTAHVFDSQTSTLRQVNRPGTNVWEAAWCGDDHLVAVVSPDPGETAWYTAELVKIDLAGGEETALYRSDRQLGVLACNPSGRTVAMAQAVCSDRGVVAGDLLLVDTENGEVSAVDTQAVDVTWLRWRGEDTLFLAGQRGLQTVAADYRISTATTTELHATTESYGKRYPEAIPLSDQGFVAVFESWTRPPELVVVRENDERPLVSFSHQGTQTLLESIGDIEEVRWNATDGLEIEGLLTRPEGDGPFPLILNVHGGPVWAYRNRWLMGQAINALLVARGYAVLYPNPRGSGGRGQEFAELVNGDMGGADTHDYLSGIDALVDRGVVDPTRLAVTGGSYGGFMSAWLVTQTDRFAASAPLAPCTNWYSQHFTSNIAGFDRMFLAADPYAAGGRYFERSPVMFASKVATPTFQVTGALDKCTPPGQAIEFHNALQEQGVESVVAVYPEEGHGVRKFPAVIDHATRMLAFFEEHVLGIKPAD